MKKGNQSNQYKIVMNNYLDLKGEFVEVVDYDGAYLYKSQKFANLEGIKSKHIIGKKIEEIYHRDDETYYLRNSLKSGATYKNIKVEYNVKSNSKKIYGIISTFPIKDDNRIVGAYSILHPKANSRPNITENNNGTRYHFDNIIGKGNSLKSIKQQAKRAAEGSSSIFLTGETGTGKELFAQSIHNCSHRSNYPFVAVNCGAVPETLIESILFGTSKGAYTGSISKVGLFEKADRGTIFLDEINSMPIEYQAKLLRVTEEKKLYRVGDNKEITVNPRIISAMNIDPETALKNGLIRPDLFYRLAVVLLELPPLRELRDDILDLGNYFINQHNCKTDTQIKKISDEVCGLFSSYRWPGNIRELKNSIDHALTVANHDEDTICIGHLPPHIAKTQNVTDNIALSGIKSFDETISEISEKIILEAFHDNKKSINQTAKRLKMSSPRLYYRLKKLNLVPNKKN
jgi:arginine utilization regulatory protein